MPKLCLYILMLSRSISRFSSNLVWQFGQRAIRFSKVCSCVSAHGTMCAISVVVVRQVGIAHLWPASTKMARLRGSGIAGLLIDLLVCSIDIGLTSHSSRPVVRRVL